MLKQGAKQLVSAANAEVESISPDDAAKLIGREGVLFVDLREPGELASSGIVKGALHVPRGLLEFQADPESPSHKVEFAKAERLVLYCGSGARSALAAKTLQDMGVSGLAHVPGGFPALKAAGAPTSECK
ncbi:MAG: rhodanese-like domain-containing protein [Pseudomonadota bacterium]